MHAIGLQNGLSLLLAIKTHVFMHAFPIPMSSFVMKYLFQHFVRNLVVFSHGNSRLIQHVYHSIRVTLLAMEQIIAIFAMGVLTADALERNLQ